MPILPLALPTGSDVGREAHAGVARLINCYAEPSGPQQKAPMQIWASPGLALLVAVTGSGGVRAILEVDGVVYAVIGRVLYQIDAGGGYAVLGGIPSDGYVGLTRNQRGSGVQLTIVCDGLAYVLAGGTLQRITDPDLPGPIDVCTVNRSTIFLTPDGRMFRSRIDDTTSIDGLDVAQAESSPDGGYRVLDRGGDLVVIGPRSYEIWQDIGGEAFGFARTYAARIGAVGPRCVTKASIISGQTVTDTVVWCAADQYGKFAGVVMLNGSTVSKISSLSIDQEIKSVADKTSIIATSWVSRGHGFVSLRLPTTTVVYNTTTQQWHDLQSRTSTGTQGTWRGSYATVINDRTMVGDAENPTIYWLDEDTSDENGDEMTVTVRTPIAHAFPGRIEMGQLYLDVVPGVGLATGASQDITPTIAMRWSNDGETWSNQRVRELGRQGQRSKRVSWTALGTHNQVTLEFQCSAAVVRGFMRASWEGRTLQP